MDVSIILVNYNTKQLTTDAINSIIKNTNGLIYEIIVIDNDSSDNSVNYIRTCFNNNVEIIEAKQNLGFGRANNIGIKKAKGKYVFFLNTDTILINNAVKILYDFIDRNKNVGICGGNLYDENSKPTHSFLKKMPSVWTIISGSILYKIQMIFSNMKKNQFNYSENIMEVAYITGADIMIKKTVLAEVGGFDPEFFMYYEETELTNRVRLKGYKVYSVPDAKIIHLQGKSIPNKNAKSNIRKYKLEMYSMFLYFEKVYGEKTVKWAYLFTQMWNLMFAIFKGRKENLGVAKDEYKRWKNVKN
ncbi:glycosyltransferase family 2 protein [Clostridium estertheticum]|uniref:glycosyltransferase family 2 protein n=1 Tax=Clostridium estertheticum TaxID=238834 RepID=UPI001C0B7D8A|nr:glycosyltransferase family 2 protein [Clostridium estertheticum]MBU3073204.1 glycosyltransferase [Clostridium estertheticum]MBU3163555.1 glycosyltransferase [Clostridium estertheticum]